MYILLGKGSGNGAGVVIVSGDCRTVKTVVVLSLA